MRAGGREAARLAGLWLLLLQSLTLVLANTQAELLEPPLDGEEELLSPMSTLLPEQDTCPDLRREFEEKAKVLKELEDGMLGDLCDGQIHCTRVIVTSDGPTAIMQGPRLGLFFLSGWNQHEEASHKYPSYYRPASEQFLYYMHEINGAEGPGEVGSMWEYWHSYSRWVVGATHNRAWGGIMIKPYDGDVACPWMLKWFRTQRWYHDVNMKKNLWNPIGNPWREDDSIFVHCYEETDFPEFSCGCQRLNISSSARISEYHPDRLGEYVLLEDKGKEGYLAPVYAAVSSDKPSYLYSHHPKGKVWTIGSSETSWSLRLNKLSSPPGPTCPLDTTEDKESGWEWEYLQSKTEGKEVWLRDLELEVRCLDPPQ